MVKIAVWKESDIVHLEECLINEPRRYNSRQLAQKLEQERGVKLSPDRLRRILKKKRLFGNEHEPAINRSKTHYDARSSRQIKICWNWHYSAGEIDQKYLDESGFCLWSSNGYTYYPIGAQKRLEQTKRRGRRLSILGLLQPCISFSYGLVIGSFSSESYIKIMENEAHQAELERKSTGRIRVIIQDNGPLHKSLDVQQK